MVKIARRMSFSGIMPDMKHVEKPISELDHLHLRLYIAHRQEINVGWNAEDVCSPYWRLYRNSEDGAEVVLADRVHPVTAGRLHLVPAWVKWTCRNVRPIDHFFVHFDLLGLPGAVVRDCFPTAIELPTDPALEGHCAAVATAIAARPPAQRSLVEACLVKSLLFHAIAVLFTQLDADRARRLTQAASASNPVAPAIRRIEEDIAADLPNRILASLCGYGEDHFVRLFRQHIGQTPAQYVLERRLTLAAERLVFSPDPIERIAEDLGFPDRYYFTRMFRRRMGLPPAAYRRTSHQGV
jgi:AraC-like DNA-binding protein